MRVVVATCTCLFLVRLAVFEKSNSCRIRTEKAECRGFLNFSLTISLESMNNHNYRILIYSHHFKTLNKTEKICILKKIMGFYGNINSRAYTNKVSKEKISVFEDHLKKFTDTCINCRKCKEIINIKPLLKCYNYSTRMVLNQTQIIHCQEWLLKRAKRKKNREQIQEKTIYELDMLKKFVNEAI